MSLFAQVNQELLKIPPVTRTIILSTLGVTLPSLLRLLSPYVLLFLPDRVMQGEVWRVPTSFLYGGSGITFLFDLLTLYRNSVALEEGIYSGRSYDYAYHLLLSSLAILIINLPLRSYLHSHTLLLSLVTLSSRLNPEQPINLMGFLSLPLKYLPYAMLGMDAVLSGPLEAGRGLTGVIVGLGWSLLLERRQAPGAPEWVKRFVGSGLRVGVTAGGSGVVNPGRAGGAGAGGPQRREREEVRATVTGHNWGQGRRLGAE
ncbi:DER1-domain-containing protein [Dacryopinax primogenitus]|uniref:Derlin n=1 Tax=Dacryopinax primogenitus (strain DJM 731) TaxID=1858805 RepID=M5G6R7_DACPD|nr:DER1-domain-containing protein [Dacryopinax primogenitus]EJT99452.1 DER1-domain-containing protein [Dacryopinax primogenitus]